MKKLLLFTTILIAVNLNAQFRLVKDIQSSGSSNPTSFFINSNGRLFFGAAPTFGSATRAIYQSDGSTAGTLILNFFGSSAIVYNDNSNIGFYEYNSYLYFDARTTSSDMALCRVSLSAPTIEPSVLYTISSATGTGVSTSRFFWAVGVNNKLLFNPVNAANTSGLEPLVVDMTTFSNSGVLRNINTTASTGSMATSDKFTVLGTNGYFAANDGTNGKELWKTDGTTAGTVLFSDINAGSGNSDPDQYNVIGTNLTFVATDNAVGRELYATTGATGNLTLIKDINATGANSSNPSNIKKIGNILYFGANNGTVGNELWKSDGSNLGTNLLKDINTGTGDSNPNNFTAVGSTIYFTANSTSTGVELWKTDGTAIGTVLVELLPITGGIVSDLTAYNGKLYFISRPTSNADKLWISDGTSSGTLQLSSNAMSTSAGLIVYNGSNGNELYMSMQASSGIGTELYAYKDPALSTNEFQLSDKAINLYPNPSKDYFELSGEVAIEKVEVYSIQGQLVKSFKNENQYAISDLAKGIYIVKINATEGIINKNLVVE